MGRLPHLLLFVLCSSFFLPVQVVAQTGTTLSGRITQAENGQALSGALVVIDAVSRLVPGVL